MNALQNCFNVAKQLMHYHPYRRHSKLYFDTFRLISSMHQFKVNTMIKYPKREIPKDSQAELPIELRNIHQTSSRLAERKNYYNILGVRKDATLRDIKKAYYVLAKRYHPDSSKAFTSPESDKKFQEIAEAYRILSDESKRLEYDLYGVVKSIKRSLPELNTKNENEQKLHRMFDEIGFTRDSGDFDPPFPIEIPEEATIKLTFLQSVRGTKKDITVKTMKKCHACAGVTGTPIKRNLVMCAKCNGSGVQAITTKAHMVRGPCKVCNGRRYVPQQSCLQCNGRGTMIVNKQVEVNVPAGVDSGDIIRVPHPNKKQQIAVRILVAKSDDFTRVGNNILSDLMIPLSQAVLGGSVKVKGVDGENNEIVLQPGTESNTKIRLVGKGVKTNSGVGDHILTVKVRIPKILSAKQRALMTAFAEMEHDEPDHKAELRKSKIRDELANLHNLNKQQKKSPLTTMSKQKMSNDLSTKRFFPK